MTRRGNHEGSKPVQRKDGRWQIALRYLDPITGLPKRTTLTGKTQKEVRDKARIARKRLDQQQPPRDASLTVEQFALRWMATTLEASDRKPTTKQWYRGQIAKHVNGSTLGATRFDRLKPSSVEAWLLELRGKGLSDSSVRSLFTILRAVLDGAVRDGFIATNPASVIKRPKVMDAKEAAFLTEDQVRSLLAAAEGSRYGLLFELLASTAMRRGEALALTWRDVPPMDRLDDSDAAIQVRGTLVRLDGKLQVTTTKTDSSRRNVPIIPRSAEVLRQLRHRQQVERLRAGDQWQDTGFIFTTELGEPCDPRNALRAMKAAVAKAGLPSTVGLHTLRHSAISIMLQHNAPTSVVSKIAGHSSISITADIYGHVTQSVSRQAMAALGAAIA